MLLYQTLAFTIQKKYEKVTQNNKFKISAPTWNEKFESPHGSFFVSDIQDCFEYIFKKHEAVTDNPSIKICFKKYKIELCLK